MRLLSLFSKRPQRRTLLINLHAGGLLNIFRRPSLFRLWEPLRENPRRDEDSLG